MFSSYSMYCRWVGIIKSFHSFYLIKQYLDISNHNFHTQPPCTCFPSEQKLFVLCEGESVCLLSSSP